MTTLASTGIRLQESAQFFISHCSIWSYLEYPKWTKIHHHLLWHVSESSSTESMDRFSRKKLLMQNKYVLFSLSLPLLLICVHLHRLTVDPVQVSWPALLPCHVKSRVGVKVRWGTPIFISLFHGNSYQILPHLIFVTGTTGDGENLSHGEISKHKKCGDNSCKWKISPHEKGGENQLYKINNVYNF